MWSCVLCESSAAGTAVERSRKDLGVCSWCEGELTRQGVERCRKCSAKCTPEQMRKGQPRHCRACDAAGRREWHQRNRESANARQRERYQRRRDAGLVVPPTAEQRREAYHRNVEASRARNRRYYARNAERIKARKLTYSRLRWRLRPAEMRVQDRVYKARRKLAILRGEQ